MLLFDLFLFTFTKSFNNLQLCMFSLSLSLLSAMFFKSIPISMANVGLELAYMVVFFENEILYIFRVI